jgi:hypothetical protein
MAPTMALKRYHETRIREAVTRLLCPDLWRARRDSNPPAYRFEACRSVQLSYERSAPPFWRTTTSLPMSPMPAAVPPAGRPG